MSKESIPLLQENTRWWDPLAALLLAATLLTASFRLMATHWTEALDISQNLVIIGLAAGLALGQSQFTRKWVTFFAIAYGVIAIPWQLGVLLNYEGVMWSERMLSLGGRLVVTLGEVIRKDPVHDNIFFILLMALVFWAMSLNAGYSLTRYGNPWQAVIPAGVFIMFIQNYDNDVFNPILNEWIRQRSWYLAIYLVFTLLTVARVIYNHQFRGMEAE